MERRGLDDVWREIERFRATLGPDRLADKRTRQARAWMWREIEEGLIAELRAQPAVARELADLEQKVVDGTLTPTTAARVILDRVRTHG